MANTLYDALFKPHEASEATFLRLKDGSTVSYAGFLALSARFAHAMAEAGITPGDRVALQAGLPPELNMLMPPAALEAMAQHPTPTAHD